MDRIAERAGLNKRLIYYYFEDKEKLFQAVLELAYRDIREQELNLRLLEPDPPTAVRRLIEFTWDHDLAHPEFLTLLDSANLHKARHLAESKRARELNSPVIETLAAVLERGRRDGTFHGGVDPVQLYVSIAGLAYFYLANRYTLSAILGRDLLSPRARAERLSHMTEVVLGARAPHRALGHGPRPRPREQGRRRLLRRRHGADAPRPAGQGAARGQARVRRKADRHHATSPARWLRRAVAPTTSRRKMPRASTT